PWGGPAQGEGHRAGGQDGDALEDERGTRADKHRSCGSDDRGRVPRRPTTPDKDRASGPGQGQQCSDPAARTQKTEGHAEERQCEQRTAERPLAELGESVRTAEVPAPNA